MKNKQKYTMNEVIELYETGIEAELIRNDFESNTYIEHALRMLDQEIWYRAKDMCLANGSMDNSCGKHIKKMAMYEQCIKFANMPVVPVDDIEKFFKARLERINKEYEPKEMVGNPG